MTDGFLMYNFMKWFYSIRFQSCSLWSTIMKFTLNWLIQHELWWLHEIIFLTLRESLLRLLNEGTTTMTARCPGLQPGPPSQTPGGLCQSYWSVSEVTWPPNLELRRRRSSGPSSLMTHETWQLFLLLVCIIDRHYRVYIFVYWQYFALHTVNTIVQSSNPCVESDIC